MIIFMIMIIIIAYCLTGITLGDDKDGLGAPVASVLENGTISRDGSIKTGDRIVSINGEDLRNASSYQARYVFDTVGAFLQFSSFLRSRDLL